MKYNYDYAAEMVKIAQSAEHQSLFGIEKLAFSRDGQKEEASEVEEEMRKLAEDKECCEECGEEKCTCHEEKEGEKEACASLEDTAGLLLEISSELEDQGQERLAAATIILADSILKTAAAKKKPKSKSKSKGKKKMTMKDRMAKMRAMQGKGKAKKTETKTDEKSEEKTESKAESGSESSSSSEV